MPDTQPFSNGHERWQRVEELFHAASALPSEARRAYLASQCIDVAMLDEVIDLLGSDSAVSDLMATPITIGDHHLMRETSSDPWLGRTLDGFEIRTLLGRGGMGVVYLGVRTDGLLAQQAAIKVMARHLQSTPAQSQFLLERDALVRLQHPHIARLVGGGVTPEQLPFLVMEYIEGRRLDEASDDPSVSLRQIVVWMLQLCDAVSYVHRNLILHRDLKPGNVLVTSDGAVKLLDFGTLKAMGPQTAVDSAMTQAGMRAVTLRYASPEHIRGGVASTAMDVFSLGMTLYRLIAGRLPDMPEQSVPQYLQLLKERTLPAPGTLMSPARRQAEPMLAKDLDILVAKAIHFEAAARYTDADAMAQDLRRALESRPLLATPPTSRDRLRRFVYRNRPLVVGGAAACLAVALGLVGMRHEARIAYAQSHRAAAGVEEERKLAHLLLSDYFTQIREVPGSTHAQTLAVARAVDYLNQLNRSATDAGLQLESLKAYRTLGSLLGSPYEANLGDAPSALKTLQQGQPLAAKLLARDAHSLDYLTASAGLETAFGQVYLGQGDGRHALPHLLAAAAFVKRIADDPNVTAKMMIQSAAVYKTLADTYGEHGDASTRDPAKVVASLRQSGLYYQRALVLQPHCCERGLTIVQATLGELLEDSDAAQALASYQQGLAVIASLPAADQTSIGFVRLTGTLRMHLGADYLILHRKAQGDALLLPEFERERAAIAADPIDIRARTDLIDLDSTALDGYAALGDEAKQESLLRESLDNLRFLTHAHPDNAVWRAQQTSGELRLATLLLQRHHTAEANALATAALPAAVSDAASPQADAATLQTAADAMILFHKDSTRALAFAKRLVAMDATPSASHLLTLAAAQRQSGEIGQASVTSAKALQLIEAQPHGLRYASELAQARAL
ncbi:serine/threonine protein kinase [Granulicella paludicola]|uniref:serine/threonine protein kinase n=1 Tax=Granulicella paludicola TaxID=474951 RepID=UPI0021DF5961|nr:serine/threonine-protein kinase [Granulicella paludicola]